MVLNQMTLNGQLKYKICFKKGFQHIFLQKQEYEDLSHVTVRRNNRAGRPH